MSDSENQSESTEIYELQCSGEKNNGKRCGRPGEPNHTDIKTDEEKFYCWQHENQKDGKKKKKKTFSKNYPVCLGINKDKHNCARKVNPDIHPEGYCRDHINQLDGPPSNKKKERAVTVRCKGEKKTDGTQCEREISTHKYPRGFCHDHDEIIQAQKQAQGRPSIPILSVLIGLATRLLEDSDDVNGLSKKRLQDLTREVISLADIKQEREPTDAEVIDWLCKGMSDKSGSSYNEVHRTSPTEDLFVVFGNRAKWMIDLWDHYDSARIPKKEQVIKTYTTNLKRILFNEIKDVNNIKEGVNDDTNDDNTQEYVTNYEDNNNIN